MRKALLALALVVVSALVALRLADDQNRNEPRATEETGRESKESAPVELSASYSPADETRTPLAEVPEREARGSAPGVGASAAAPPGTTLQLAGTIVVADENGVEHAAEDGTFSLVEWRGGRAHGRAIEVRAGRWTSELQIESELGALEGILPRDYVLGGRRAEDDVEVFAGRPVPQDGFLALRVRWPARTLLHVRDGATNLDLSPVLLCDAGELEHPGIACENATNAGASPVEVPMLEHPVIGLRRLHVRSPGYGWGRIEIDETRGGERILLLDPAGELEVVVAGVVSEPWTKLRLWRDDRAPVFEELLTSPGTTRIESLAAGTYRVAAEVGEHWHEPLVLDEMEALVLPGQRQHVTLELPELAPRARVRFSGTLVIPEEWGHSQFSLGFTRFEGHVASAVFSFATVGTRAEDDRPSTYHWSSPLVEPGFYVAEVENIGFGVLLELDQQGQQDVRIEVPPPAEVRVRCADASTDEDIGGVRVSGLCWLPPPYYPSSRARFGVDPVIGRWVARMPLGRAWLHASCDGYESEMDSVSIAQGVNEFVLRLEHQTALRVVLRDGRTQVPYTSEPTPWLESVDGQRIPAHVSVAGSMTFVATGSGRYTLSIPDIPGYEPIPETTVRLEKGVVKEHVVELVRRP